MTQPQFTREQLEQRRDEVLAQLEKVNKAERIELDSDMEEQAIQVEQEEVATSMEASLRRELTAIEGILTQMGESRK